MSERLYPTDVPPMSDAAEKKAESSAPDTEEKSDIQLEPTQEEMERERLTSKAEQVKTDDKPSYRMLGALV